MIMWATIVLFVLLFAFTVYINAKLFAYIRKLEKITQEQVDKNDRLFQSLKELVQEGYLLQDGRLKKFIYEKDRNMIYNGISVEDSEVNF